MKIFRLQGARGFSLSLELNGNFFDLTAASPDLTDISAWLSRPDPLGAIAAVFPAIANYPFSGGIQCRAPVDVQEVWACGVTYERSKVARMKESEGGGDLYDLVYSAARPELFFKSTARRVVGTGQPVRIRRDSAWNVPEPELALVLSAAGKIVGYTIGNDMSSRSIEGENPLYLPQAKVYDGSCALGPGVLLANETQISRAILMKISRREMVVFSSESSTAKIRRPLQELANYLFRELTFPDGVVLLTGTGIVPPDNFTLESGDTIAIAIEGIGTLVNTVA
ncbi:MAG: fumarylacetoacetate hydrolase family protein [Pyrinomonadaceae bacterium]